MAGLDLDDPYALATSPPPASTGASTDTPDYVITEEPLFACYADAAGDCLPGAPHHFDGFGGQPIGGCETPLLRRVQKWIASSPDRAVRYARLTLAIAHVLRVRRAAHTPSSPSFTDSIP